MIATTKPFSQTSNTLADSSDSALKSSEHLASEALDTLSDKVQGYVQSFTGRRVFLKRAWLA